MAVHAFIAQANLLLLLTTHYSPLTTYYLLLTAYHLLLTAYCLLLTAYCSLLTAHCLLGAGQRRRRLHLSHVPGGVRVPAPQGGQGHGASQEGGVGGGHWQR